MNHTANGWDVHTHTPGEPNKTQNMPPAEGSTAGKGTYLAACHTTNIPNICIQLLK